MSLDKTLAAFTTLEFLGYTWEGGEQWKPPLGPSKAWSEGYKHGLWQGQNCAKPAASGEPVAEVRMAHESFGFVLLGDLPPDGTRLYATPQPAPALAPLTDKQAMEIAVTATPPGSMASRHQIVEAIRLAERHHGIFPSKENPL